MCEATCPLKELEGEDLETFKSLFISRLGAPEPSPKFKLNLAASTGDLSRVNYLLRKGADVDSVDYFNLTPLHSAVMNKHMDVVRALVNKGADLDVEFAEGDTPLACANEAGSFEIVKFLVENGANIHTVSQDDFYLLHDAVICGFPDQVKFFIEKGLDVNCACKSSKKQGTTPLHLAILKGRDELVKLLIQKGANVNAGGSFDTTKSKKVEKNVTPLHLALSRGENGQAISKLLVMSGADTNARSSSNLTPLHFASQNGFLDLVNIFLSNKGDANCETNGRVTPLLVACKKNHYEVVKALLDVPNINVNCTSLKSGAPIHQAAFRGHLKILKLLVDKGADINSKFNELNYTPLLAAAAGSRLKTCEFLVKLGADIITRDVLNYTLLSLACSQASFLDFAKKLIELGADVNGKMKCGWTALHRAVQQKNMYAVNLLIDSGANVNAQSDDGWSILHDAVAWGDTSVITLLISKGANMNVKTTTGVTPLHLAGKNGKKDVTELLLKKGASYDAKTNFADLLPGDLADTLSSKDRKTLLLIKNLFLAVSKNDHRLLKRCVEEGVMVNVKNNSGRTPIFYAVSNGNVEGTKILLANKADFYQVTNSGNTLLHISALQKQAAVVEVLLLHVKKQGPVPYKNYVNTKNVYNGNTALHISAENDDLATIKLLLEHGAMYNVRNSASLIPSQLSKEELVKNLLKKVELLFISIMKSGDEEALEISDVDRSNMNARDLEDGGTFLYWSFSKGHLDNVISMIDNGADYSMVTNDGSSLLHLASAKGNSNFIKALLSRMASEDPTNVSKFVNAATTDGTVALHIASSVQVAKVLLQHGALYNIKNKVGRVPHDTTKNSGVKNMLHVVNELFDDAKNGKPIIVDKVTLLEAEEALVVSHARNDQNNSLLQVLSHNNHKLLASKLSKILK